MRLRPALTLAVIAALLVAFLTPAHADGERRRKSRVDAAMKDLRHDMNETSRELRAAARSLRRAESRLPGARARVARVRGQLVAARAAIGRAHAAAALRPQARRRCRSAPGVRHSVPSRV